jgi:AraC-like DNA-binding protein
MLRKQIREFWLDYKSEVFFFLVSVCLVVLSTWWGRFIPDEVYDNILTPIFNTCIIALSFGGAWMLFRRSEGIRARRLFAVALLVWGTSDLIYLVGWAVAPHCVMDMAAYELTTYELVLGNILGWVLLLYPTEALRPGWMNWKRAFLQLLPLVALMAFDYIMPFNLWPVIALYPYMLLVMLFSHMRAYRKWCEDNFSSLDNIDVRWIIRYSVMLCIVGLNYVWMCSTHYHTRGFTQQWFVVVMIIYATEQILFRKDPWREVRRDDVQGTNSPTTSNNLKLLQTFPNGEASNLQTLSNGEALKAEQQLFEHWMAEEKPYLRPDFQLTDLRVILPKNRTYLSQFLNDAYGCSFYRLVNRYRVEEAQRLMSAHPEMKLSDIASACGFSSLAVFSRAFTRQTGVCPRGWNTSKM